MSTQELPAYTEQEVASHNTPESLWITIDDKVYDVTAFQDSHPGGQEVLLDNAGKDATSAFADIGHSQDAVELRDGTYLIGTLKPAGAANSPSQRCCGWCGQRCRALTIGATVVVVAAAAVGIYFAYKALKK